MVRTKVTEFSEDEIQFCETRSDYSKKIELLDSSKFSDELKEQIDEINEHLKNVNKSYIDIQNRLDLLESTVTSGVSSIKFDKKGEKISVEWNDGIRHQLGYENEEDFPNSFKSWENSIPIDIRASLIELFGDVTKLTSGPDITHSQHPMICKGGEVRWFDAVSKLIRRKDGSLEEILASWRDITVEHNKDIYIDQLEIVGKMFDFCYYIRLDYNSYKQIKTNDNIQSLDVITGPNPFENLKAFTIEAIRSEDQEATLAFIDPTTLQERLKQHGIDTLEVYSPIVKDWYRLYFIGGHKKENGEYRDVIYGTSVITEEKEQEQEYRKKINEQLEILNNLSRNFRNVYIANINNGTARILKIDDNYRVEELHKLKNKVFPYEKAMNHWIKQRVHNDDKEKLFKALSVENLKKVLADKDDFIGNYRSKDGGEMHNYQFNISKLNDKGDVIAGFQITDDIIREHLEEEKKQREKDLQYQRQLKKHSDLISALATIYTTIFRANVKTHKYEVLNSVDLMGKVAGVGGAFDDVKEDILSAFISEDMRDEMREFLDLDTMAERLRDINTIAIEYIDPSGRWFQGRFIVKNRDEAGEVLEVLYVARDFTKEKEKELNINCNFKLNTNIHFQSQESGTPHLGIFQIVLRA